MKILYIITKSNWGGAQRHVHDLAIAMKAKGHDVWVAVGGDGLLKQKLEDAGIYTFSIAKLGRDMSLGKDAGSFAEIYSLIKSKRPDVVHLHSPKAAGLGTIAARLLGVKKIIVTIHGWSFNESRPWYERAAIMISQWLTALASHTTIVISEHDQAQAQYFPFIKHKIRLIPLGIKPPVFISIDGAKQEIARLCRIDTPDFSKKTVVGCIAELHANKGLSYLIEAMKPVIQGLSQVIVIIIGDGEKREELASEIEAAGLTGNIFLPGYLDNAAEYLKAFSMFVLPSVKEGLPYVILEAGAAGLPVVATAVGGISDIIDDMKSGILVLPRKPRELGHAVSFMIEHPDERKHYGAALKEKVATKFSFDRMIWVTESLYAAISDR
ncbi:MAG: glycosyltransferase family 4 protein [Patescibacteria group bacterium]|nr:glycosyltransferase family 4 protein [Patescibacteria group bacterium]MDE2172714.1 glycosyltransferase family 4 protein [Patescibacteria group bacterium]